MTFLSVRCLIIFFPNSPGAGLQNARNRNTGETIIEANRCKFPTIVAKKPQCDCGISIMLPRKNRKLIVLGSSKVHQFREQFVAAI
jgi:hypothetical protein